MTRESGLKPSKPMSIRHPSRQECIDAIPRHAYRLGIDGDGRTHYHAAGTHTACGSSRTAKSSTDRDSAASPLRRGSATSRNTTVGKSANALNSQRAKRSSRRLSRGSTRDVYRPRAQAHQRGRDRLRSRSDRHQRRRAPADARARPLDAGGRRRGRGRPGDRPRRALANAELSVRDISPQGQTRVVEAVA